jgi:hypothetical protein
MKKNLYLWSSFVALALPTAVAQDYLTPKLGGGQVAAEMVHIDIYYDAEANQLHARVDDSHGIPELRALAPGEAFDPEASYAVLNGKAYNAQYGWNVGGFFTIPPGAAIWIELTDASPHLETYEGWGRTGSHIPIFGTDNSPLLWKWSGVMVHNTYAVFNPVTDRFFAEYHIYFGDPATGSPAGFEQYDDTAVRLEWTTVPVDDPLTFRFGASSDSPGSPLVFLNAEEFVTQAEFVVNLYPSHDDAFEGNIPMLAVPATAAHGGPALQHAAVGSCLEVRFVSLTGPPGAGLSVAGDAQSQPLFTVPVGELDGTHRSRISRNAGEPGSDPYGRLTGQRWWVDQPGLYCLGFELIDTSANGPDGGPIHVPSVRYQVYLQAGLTIASFQAQNQSLTATFGGEPAKSFYLERASLLSSSDAWQTVAGPVTGTNRLLRLTDPATAVPCAFYRIRAMEP